MSNPNILTPMEWTLATLKADPAVAAAVGERVYPGIVPPEIPDEAIVYPYIVVNVTPLEPWQNAYTDILAFEDMVDAVVWDLDPSRLRAAAIWNDVLAALHQKSGTTTAGTVLSCVFAGLLPGDPEVEGMNTFQKAGGEFRVTYQ